MELKQLEKLKKLDAYEIKESRYIADLDSDGYVLRHKKTGAKVVLLSNDDDNKVFYIGFRTPPTDSTGVAHIIEHSVLCGSDKYPVKDPFIELAKGSLNTFLNAMTFPDKTLYPVASCNDQDFANLVDVYLDAVFHPNIYHNEKIFRQEGWHYELENADADIKINGVVYNEMKGAFSSPDDVVEREIMNALFPDTSYGVESGGDPDVIPELTYEDYLDFHGRYYHPSNSYIYLYGDCDMAEKLDYIDREYLSAYEALEIDSRIRQQAPFSEPRHMKETYPVAETESEKEHTYLVYAMAMNDNLDQDAYIALDALDYAICSAPGAPLKKALIDAGIGKDVYSEYESGIMQPYFSIIAKDTDEDRLDDFVNIIENTLKEQAQGALDHTSIRAALNVGEFRYREADFGSYPKGLMLGLQMLDSWLYDETRPFMHIEANDTYKRLKDDIDTGYYEKMIAERMINNDHKVILTVVPERGLTGKKDAALAEKLAQYKKSMSAEQIDEMVKATAALTEYQESPDDEKALASIPLLKREDMKKEAAPLVNEIRKIGDTTAVYHDIFTNGISYLRLMFDMKEVPEEDWIYVGMLKTVMGLMDTKEHTYGELFNEINLRTGGIVPLTNAYIDNHEPDKFMMTYEIKAKTLSDHVTDAMELMEEMILHSDYTDRGRLFELVQESKSHMQSSMISAGHQVAVSEGCGEFSEVDATVNAMNGIPMLRLLEKLEADYDEMAAGVIDKLYEVSKIIFRPENLIVDYAGPGEGYDVFKELTAALTDKLCTEPLTEKGGWVKPNPKRMGYTSAAQVQYVARCGSFRSKGLKFNGALRALKVMMGYDYLWTNVRVKGGAYGCMSFFGNSGKSYFVSYRDPNLARTVDVYEQAAEYVRNFDADERTMTQFIIGAVADLDVPMTPSRKQSYSLSAYMCSRTYEDIQRDRDELLAATPEVIRGLAKYIDAFMETGAYCVVGGEEKVKECRESFDEVEPLFS